MKKKTIIILIIIAIFIFSLIFVFFSSCEQKQSYDLTIESVNKDRVFYPNLFADKNEIYYLSDLGIIWYKYNLETNEKTKIFNEEILAINDISYSQDGKYAVVYSDYPDYNIHNYDFTKQSKYKLDININNITWQRNNLLYVYEKYNENSKQKYTYEITQSKEDGTNWKAFNQVKSDDQIGMILYAHKEGEYYHMNVPSNEYEGMTLYKSYNSNFDKNERITAEKSVFSEIVFSKDFSKIVYLNSENQILLQDLGKIESVSELGLMVDNIYKIAWSNDGKYIYYIEDLNKLIRLEINNKKITEYELDSSQIDYTNMLDEQIKNLGLSQDDKTLYFTYNNYIYKIDLTK